MGDREELPLEALTGLIIGIDCSVFLMNFFGRIYFHEPTNQRARHCGLNLHKGTIVRQSHHDVRLLSI